MCACGKPLHYTNKKIEAQVRELVAQHGPNIPVKIEGRTYLIPRHYIALHGLKAAVLNDLATSHGFQEVTGTPEAESKLPDEEILRQITILIGKSPADVGIYKMPKDKLGLTRVSLGGDTSEAVYVKYSGTIQQAIHMTEICLGIMKIQAKTGEAPPLPTRLGGGEAEQN